MQTDMLEIATECTILSHCESVNHVTSSGWGVCFTTENCKKTMTQPVIVVPITNGMSEESMKVTEVMKVTLPNQDSREGATVDAITPES